MPPDKPRAEAAGSRVFTIPPGAPFLETLSDALLDGALVPGFGRDAGPLGLAAATPWAARAFPEPDLPGRSTCGRAGRRNEARRPPRASSRG